MSVPAYRLPTNIGSGTDAPEYLPGQEPSQIIPDGERRVPVAEKYAGANNAYRGTEDHGVPNTTGDLTEMSPEGLEYYGTITEKFEPEDPEIGLDPVEVRIVERTETRVITTTQFNLTEIIQTILPGDPARYRAIVSVGPGSFPCYIKGDDSNPSSTNGFQVNPETPYESTVNGEVKAVCATGETCTVFVLAERKLFSGGH